MTTRSRVNFQSGTASGVVIGNTTITGTSWPVPVGGYTGSNYVAVTLNPGYQGSSTPPEVFWIQSVSSINGGTNNVASGIRGQEGTSQIGGGSDFAWVSGPLASDFGFANMVANGDLPTPTVSGQFLSSTSTSGAAWVSGVPTQTISGYTASGTNQGTATPVTTQYATVVGATATANGSSGKGVILPAITASGQEITIDNTDSTHWLLIYPATGSSIDGATTNSPVWIAPSAYWKGVAENSTSWASIMPSLNSGVGVNATYGNGSIIFSSALKMFTVNAGTPVTISGFNNYLVLVNGYGSRTSNGYLTTALNANGSAIVTANTYAVGGASLYSLSNMNIYNNSSSWTATLTNTNYSNGSGFAIIIGIN